MIPIHLWSLIHHICKHIYTHILIYLNLWFYTHHTNKQILRNMQSIFLSGIYHILGHMFLEGSWIISPILAYKNGSSNFRWNGHWGVGMGWVVWENLEWYLAWLNSFFGVLRYPKNMQHVYLVILEYQWFLTIKVIKGTNRWWDEILTGATGLGWWMVMHRVRPFDSWTRCVFNFSFSAGGSTI